MVPTLKFARGAHCRPVVRAASLAGVTAPVEGSLPVPHWGHRADDTLIGAATDLELVPPSHGNMHRSIPMGSEIMCRVVRYAVAVVSTFLLVDNM